MTQSGPLGEMHQPELCPRQIRSMAGAYLARSLKAIAIFKVKYALPRGVIRASQRYVLRNIHPKECVMRTVYRAIMDPSVNPLSNLRPAQRFQAMLFLSVMWTTIFCAGAGAWFWYGELMSLHVLLSAGTLVTGFTFYRAKAVATYRDFPANDGYTRYDDVWGA